PIIASQGTLAASGNYGFAFNNAGSLTVNPKALTITANDATQTYNGVPFSGGNGGTPNGVVNGQNASAPGGSLGRGSTFHGGGGGKCGGRREFWNIYDHPVKPDALELRNKLRQCAADDQPAAIDDHRQ